MSFRQFSVYLHERQVLFIHFVVVVAAIVVAAAALCMGSTYIYTCLDNQYVLCTLFFQVIWGKNDTNTRL